MVVAGAGVEQPDDDARAPAAVGVSVTPSWWLLAAASLLLTAVALLFPTRRRRGYS